MANPITALPKKVDPRQELQRRLDAAPLQHAEALLVAFDVLEEAHKQGLLDMIHGAVGSKNAIFGKLAEYGSRSESTNAIRNALLLAQLLGNLDPDSLQTALATADASRSQRPPSLWQIFRTMRSEEGRRGLGLMAALLAAMGRSSKR
ncbi:MAG TPA: DUF1641 domain-containing protein [Acidobacteriaceae bacterium]